MNQQEKTDPVIKKVLLVYSGNQILDVIYHELAEYFQEHHIPCETHSSPIGSEEDSAEEIEEYVKERGISLIVLGSRLFQLMKGRLKVPLLEIQRSYYDYYMSIKKAKCRGEKVAMVYWGPLEAFEEEYFAELREYAPIHILKPKAGETVNDREARTRRLIKKLKQEQYDFIVGVGMVYDIAVQEGLKAEFIRFSKHNLIQTIREILYQSELFEQDQENLQSLRGIFRELDEGVIVTDSYGKIQEINDAARNIFSEERRIEEKSILDVFPLERVAKAMEDEREISRFVCTVRKKTFMLNLHISYTGRQKRYIFIFFPSAVVRAMEREIQINMSKKGYVAKNTFENIHCVSERMEELKKKAARYAGTESTVLLYGESGTGKELFAQSIHNASARRKYPFVAVNCGALPENLLESELFGYVKGAFTGARAEGKRGIFEIANKGTLFLDEIGELPLSMQVRLLRVLQEREIVRIGDDQVLPVDVRILAATNRNLYNQVKNGRFREDLYYRLNVLTLRIPPIRERREDIPVLLSYFLKQRCGKYLEPAAMRECMDYLWPGNVREMMNVTERLSLLAENESVGREEVHEALEIEFSYGGMETEVSGLMGGSTPTGLSVPVPAGGNVLTKSQILEVLEKNRGNRKKTAQELGISTTTLWRRLK